MVDVVGMVDVVDVVDVVGVVDVSGVAGAAARLGMLAEEPGSRRMDIRLLTIILALVRGIGSPCQAS